MSKNAALLPLKTIADLLGVAPQTIRNRGYKIVKKLKGDSLYNAREIVRDHIKGIAENKMAQAVDAEKLRMMKLQSEKLSMKNSQTRAELLHIDDVIQLFTQHIQAAKTKLRGISKTLAIVISDNNSPQKNAKLILDNIDKALKEVEIDTREYKKAASRRLRASVEAAGGDAPERMV